MNQINRLEQRKTNNEEEIKNLKKKEADLEGDIREIKQRKTEQITKLKGNIETMSQDFANMLKETLEEMKNKIKKADEKWEEENDGAMLKRFEEAANPKIQ